MPGVPCARMTSHLYTACQVSEGKHSISSSVTDRAQQQPYSSSRLALLSENPLLPFQSQLLVALVRSCIFFLRPWPLLNRVLKIAFKLCTPAPGESAHTLLVESQCFQFFLINSQFIYLHSGKGHPLCLALPVGIFVAGVFI